MRKLNNYSILILPMILIFIGIITLFSISNIVPAGNYSGMTKIIKMLRSYPIKQGISALFSLFVFYILTKFSYFIFKKYAYVLYMLIIIILAGMFIYGKASHGSRRWIPLGFFNLQPSELMKITIVFCLARFMMYKNNLVKLKGLFVPFILTLIPMIFVVIQPDLGTSLVFFPILFAMLFAAGAKPIHLIVTVICMLISIPIVFNSALKNYQKMRILAFIQPENPEYSMYEAYQLNQSLIAVSTGGILGKGNKQTTKGLVPEQHNDFIFSAIAESWGLLGGCLVILIYLLFLFQCMGIAFRSREPFGRLAAVGITTYFAVQIFVNIAMTIGIAPITGLTLPFVSYGGSSLLTSFFAIAFVYNVGKEMKPSFSSRDIKVSGSNITIFDLKENN